MNIRELFMSHIAQTSDAPVGLDIIKAEGTLLFDRNGNNYIDLVGGISVANTGHRHPKVMQAIAEQSAAYLHVMVYGEFIETPQVQYAYLLSKHLPSQLDSVYFTNSGAEAVEGAMKLAKRVTGKTKILCFDRSYHGSTQGALSIMGDEEWRNSFRPLLPGIMHATYNDDEAINRIDEHTAMVILELVQAEAGVNSGDKDWIRAIKNKCDEKGALLVVDEIQTGFGRTGTLWAFEQFDIVPDILLLGKALGGGLPLGAFISSRKKMNALTNHPVLGHLTTFGGHPLSCAAGMAAMNVLLNEIDLNDVEEKGRMFEQLLKSQQIRKINRKGLWLALEFESFEQNKKIIDHCIQHGVFTDWFLFSAQSLRISPPLTISKEEIEKACSVIISAIDLSIRK